MFGDIIMFEPHSSFIFIEVSALQCMSCNSMISLLSYFNFLKKSSLFCLFANPLQLREVTFKLVPVILGI